MKMIKSIQPQLKLFILAMILFSAYQNNAQAQKIGTGLVGSSRLIEDNHNYIISFSPVFNDGKTYLRWLVQNDEKDGLYIVERSDNGIEFEALGFRERIGSTLCVNLFYSYVDEAPFQGSTYYRIMQVSTDQTYKYSDVVKVRTDMNAPQQSGTSVLKD
ncbi:MAG: hypothetical protein ACK4GL_03020 [Flavobacteriales bacterium]